MSTLIIYSTMAMLLAGLYMLLSFRFWKVVLGLMFLSHASHLILLSSGGFFQEAKAPIYLKGVAVYMDPLPQALILTAIVISFGMTMFVMVVLRQLFTETRTTSLEEVEQNEWRGPYDDEH